MEEKIKKKVREIQSKYCGASVETKLYYAIEETIKEYSHNDLTKPLKKMRERKNELLE